MQLVYKTSWSSLIYSPNQILNDLLLTIFVTLQNKIRHSLQVFLFFFFILLWKRKSTLSLWPHVWTPSSFEMFFQKIPKVSITFLKWQFYLPLWKHVRIKDSWQLIRKVTYILLPFRWSLLKTYLLTRGSDSLSGKNNWYPFCLL